MEILSGALLDLGISLNNEETSGPVPLENEPKLDFLDTQKKLEPRFTITTKNLGLSPKEASEAAALAVALLIQQAASVLNPNTAFAIALYGFIEGSKTYPAPVVI